MHAEGADSALFYSTRVVASLQSRAEYEINEACVHADTEARDEAVKQAEELAAEEAQDAVEDLVEAQLAAAAVPGQSGHERAEVLAARAGRFRREGRVAVRRRTSSVHVYICICRVFRGRF